MQNRTTRGILITKQHETNQENYDRYRDRKEEQRKYQQGHELPQIPIGSNILYYSHIRAQWYPGVVVERFHDRTYKIISEKGRIICRNRIDLKVYHKEVSIKFEDPKDLPSPPREIPNQNKLSTDRQTVNRHDQKRHLASSHSPQTNSSNFDKSHKQSKSSSQSMPLVHNVHDNSNRKHSNTCPSYASPSSSHRNVSQNVSQSDSHPNLRYHLSVLSAPHHPLGITI